MFRVTRLGLAKTGGQGRRLVSFFSNDKNAGFGLKKISSFAQKSMDKMKKISEEVSDNFIFYLVIAYGIWLNIFMPLKRKYG
uniref:Uncharacterized protein n=1 Tax=Meloidogyne javanica TaxID=6303 RepID=A0A915MD89_MELJA